jgi:hypothetical protein
MRAELRALTEMEDSIMTVTKLRPPGEATEPDRGDPLRKELAAAIEAAGKAREMCERQKQAAQRLWAEAREAEETIERLHKAVGKATEAHIASLADAAATGEPAPASGVPRAKKAVEVATDHLDALKAARKKLESDAPELAKDVVAADTEVERSISQVLLPIAEQMIERGRQVAEQLAPIKRTLSALWCEGDRPSQWDAQAAFEIGRSPLKETREAAADFLRSTSAAERAVPDPWLVSRARLRKDPHAGLPELDALLSDSPVS